MDHVPCPCRALGLRAGQESPRSELVPKCCGLSWSSCSFRVCEPKMASGAALSLLRTRSGNLCSHRKTGLLPRTHTRGETRICFLHTCISTKHRRLPCSMEVGRTKGEQDVKCVEWPLTSLQECLLLFPATCKDSGGSR